MASGHLLLLVAATTLASMVAAHAETVRITMKNLEISPAVATARVGDTLQWTNQDLFIHTATARNGEFDVNLQPGDTATFVLKKAGTVDYYCRYHPNMTATVTVTP